MDSAHLIDLKKFIKQENPVSRLTSLKLPRDLTLGGSTLIKPKRQFVPNLNVVRNKNKAKEALKRNENKNKDQKSGNSIVAKRKDRFVQSSGIFSTGFNSDIKRTSARFGGDRRSDKENDGANTLAMPLLMTKNWEVDSKTETNVFEDLVGCDEDMVDEKLPFEPIPWFSQKLKTEIKPEIKTEDNNCDGSSMQPTFNKLKINGASNEYMEDDVYDDYKPALSIWKLPDSLCGKGLSDDPNCKDVFDYCLKDLTEGQIGKLVVRKSGKMEVHIGRVKYSLDTPELDFYKEEIVKLEQKNKNEGEATILGEVKNRFSLNPDWSTLLP